MMFQSLDDVVPQPRTVVNRAPLVATVLETDMRLEVGLLGIVHAPHAVSPYLIRDRIGASMEGAGDIAEGILFS